jgi:hypothetical protein
MPGKFVVWRHRPLIRRRFFSPKKPSAHKKGDADSWQTSAYYRIRAQVTRSSINNLAGWQSGERAVAQLTRTGVADVITTSASQRTE